MSVEPEDVEIEAVRIGPIYQRGQVYMDNPDLIKRLDLTDCDFGVQISEDGRVWVCINGIAWIRFKPAPKPIDPSMPEIPTNEDGTTNWPVFAQQLLDMRKEPNDG